MIHFALTQPEVFFECSEWLVDTPDMPMPSQASPVEPSSAVESEHSSSHDDANPSPLSSLSLDGESIEDANMHTVGSQSETRNTHPTALIYCMFIGCRELIAKDLLETHVRDKHVSVGGPFICRWSDIYADTTCGREFGAQLPFLKHVVDAHSGVDRVLCSGCNQTRYANNFAIHRDNCALIKERRDRELACSKYGLEAEVDDIHDGGDT